MPDSLIPPVLVIGATRSGTSMLSEILSLPPTVCLWYEPATLWRIGHAYRSSDVATSDDAKQWVKRRIRREFVRYQQSHGGARIVEKTPMNALRVKYVAAILPDAPIIHVVRDGRGVLRSRLKKYKDFSSYTVDASGTRSHIRRRISITPWWELPAYLPRFVRGLLRRYALKERGVEWFGVRYPGWKRDKGRLSLPQIIAKQWVLSVETAQSDLRELRSSRYMEVRYEDIVSEPRHWFSQLYEFADLPLSEEILDYISANVHQKSVNRWKDTLDSTVIEEAMPIMRSALSDLGYFD